MKRTSFWSGQVAAPEYGPCRPADLNWAGRYRRVNLARCTAYPKVVAGAGSSTLHKTLVTYSGMRLTRGSTGPVVRAVQRVIGVDADGSFGPVTEAAVIEWQTRHGLRGTGAVNAATWRTLLKATVHPSGVGHPAAP